MNEECKALDRMKLVCGEGDSSPMRRMMKMMEERSDLVSLSAGEANFDAPEELIELAVQAMRDGKNRYTSTNGIPGIRKAVADFLADRWNVEVDPDCHILMTVGGMEAIFLATRILLEPGDRVLLPDPGWGVMRPVVERLGARPEYYPLVETGQWIIDPEPLLARMDEKTKMVVINSPSNPTGATLTRDGFAAIVEKARDLGVFILSDEVYHNYTYQGEHVSALAFGLPENVVVVNSFSKTFAVTGWRLGYAVAHPRLIQQMGVFKESISLCSFSIGQWAMASYLPGSAQYLNRARELCRGNMEDAVRRLNAIPGVRCTHPRGGLYVFPDFSRIEPSSQRLFERLLDGGVAVVPGAFFGSRGEGHARIMFAASPDRISAGLDRIEAVLKGS